MKALGYTTGIIGKWHVGSGEGYLPTQRGFDEFYGYLPYGIAAEPPNGPPIYRGTNIVERPKNHMEQFCTEAISFLDRHAKEPFLLYLPFSAVHGPFVGPQPWIARFDDMTPANRRKYAADVSQMDDIIGRVMAKLRALGLEENTLVFFISDNGGPGGASSNAPLRGTKWTVWEGGIRVPFIAQWRGHIPAGRVLEQQVMQIDFLPTAVAAAGGEVKSDWNLDGVNLLPLLEGKSAAEPHAALFWRFGIQYGVRQGDWKLVKPSIESAPLLFDLSKDISEQNNLAAAEPVRVKELQALWDAWNAKNEAPRWIDERWNGHGNEAHKPAGKGGKGGKKKAASKSDK
jgi:arylsulfatase A-like enzyme